MKELDEYKAEIYRRSDERKANRKIMHRRTATLCIVLALCIALGTFAAFRFTGNKNETPILPPESSTAAEGTRTSDNIEFAGLTTEQNGGTSETPSQTETEKNGGDTIQVPYNGGGSVDLMQGIASKRELKGVDKSSISVKLTDFAVRLFKQANEKGKSTLVSPLSVIMALAMTANGADGMTLAQMEKTLGMDIDTLNEALALYRESLPQGEKYKFDIANAIWFKTDPFFKVNADFLQKNADWYDAGLYAAPFDRTTLDEINLWVKTHTGEMIDKILDHLSPDAVMCLVNALSFRAEWNEVYNERQVLDHDFTLEDKTVKKTGFMFSQEDVYLQDDQAEGFIKYYKDKKYAFAALLPGTGIKVSDYVDSLTGEKLCAILSSAQKTKVQAAIPKFKTESSFDLNDILIKMGMPRAFDKDDADFSRLGSYDGGNLYIGQVLHKTFIEVAEQGTKAGAATAVIINKVTSVGPPEPPKQVYLDRPFVYMLIDCETNIPFFIGTLTDVG